MLLPLLPPGNTQKPFSSTVEPAENFPDGSQDMLPFPISGLSTQKTQPVVWNRGTYVNLGE